MAAGAEAAAADAPLLAAAGLSSCRLLSCCESRRKTPLAAEDWKEEADGCEARAGQSNTAKLPVEDSTGRAELIVKRAMWGLARNEALRLRRQRKIRAADELPKPQGLHA